MPDPTITYAAILYFPATQGCMSIRLEADCWWVQRQNQHNGRYTRPVLSKWGEASVSGLIITLLAGGTVSVEVTGLVSPAHGQPPTWASFERTPAVAWVEGESRVRWIDLATVEVLGGSLAFPPRMPPPADKQTLPRLKLFRGE